MPKVLLTVTVVLGMVPPLLVQVCVPVPEMLITAVPLQPIEFCEMSPFTSMVPVLMAGAFDDPFSDSVPLTVKVVPPAMV